MTDPAARRRPAGRLRRSAAARRRSRRGRRPDRGRRPGRLGRDLASRDDLLAEWGQPRFDLERNAWLVMRRRRPAGRLRWVLDSADHTCIDGAVRGPSRRTSGAASKRRCWTWIERSASRARGGRRAPAGACRSECGAIAATAAARSTARPALPTCARSGACAWRSTACPTTRSPTRRRRASKCAASRAAATSAPCGPPAKTPSPSTSASAPSPSRSGCRSTLTEGSTPVCGSPPGTATRWSGVVICYVEPYGGYVDQLAVRRPGAAAASARCCC